jgi:nickel superoxide dismutase
MKKLLQKLIKPVYAHCDLPCGVYDPAQARIEAESVLKIMQKYQENDDQAFRTRALIIKEERAELVKKHLWVLWTDYFKPEHLEKFPQIHELFWKATKQAIQLLLRNYCGRLTKLLRFFNKPSRRR